MPASIQRLLESFTVGQVVTTVVDIALVYYLIYRLLLTIRGTRAAQMIVGIVLRSIHTAEATLSPSWTRLVLTRGVTCDII